MLTARQRKIRQNGIGSSDAAAIMGRDPYRTPWDVWAEKTGRATPAPDAGDAARIGAMIEPVILLLAAERLGERVVKATSTYVRGRLRANVDGMVGKAKRGSAIVEAKRTHVWDGWGKDGTQEIPERVLIQVHHQMYCAESDLCWVACLRSGFRDEFTMHPIKRDEALVRKLVQECEGFWKNHVRQDIEPPRTRGSATTLADVVRIDGKSTTVDAYLVERLMRAKSAAALAEHTYEDLKAEVITALGDADNAQAGDYVVSYRSVERKALDGDRLRRELPAIAEQYAKVTASRRFECRNVRAGGVVE
jgi:putative phage-type endonuclease